VCYKGMSVRMTRGPLEGLCVQLMGAALKALDFKMIINS
jgi:hypothetical protein